MDQSKTSEDYQPVDIDSLLQSPIAVPKDRHHVVKKIAFSISMSEIIGVGKVGSVIRDRFIQLNKLNTDREWKYKFGCAYFEIRNKNLALVFSKPEQLERIVKLYTSSRKEKIIIKAKMLIGNFKRYNVTRDFLIQDIQVNK